MAPATPIPQYSGSLPLLPDRSTSAGPPRLPSIEQVEAVFLSALQIQTTAAVARLMEDHWSLTDWLFPGPGNPSPLSQPLLLSLFHRVSFDYLNATCLTRSVRLRSTTSPS